MRNFMIFINVPDLLLYCGVLDVVGKWKQSNFTIQILKTNNSSRFCIQYWNSDIYQLSCYTLNLWQKGNRKLKILSWDNPWMISKMKSLQCLPALSLSQWRIMYVASKRHIGIAWSMGWTEWKKQYWSKGFWHGSQVISLNIRVCKVARKSIFYPPPCFQNINFWENFFSTSVLCTNCLICPIFKLWTRHQESTFTIQFSIISTFDSTTTLAHGSFMVMN